MSISEIPNLVQWLKAKDFVGTYGPPHNAPASELVSYVEHQLVEAVHILGRPPSSQLRTMAELSRLVAILGCARDQIEATEEAHRSPSTREREAATWRGWLRRLLRIVLHRDVSPSPSTWGSS